MQSKSASLNIQNKIKIINLSPCNLNIEYNNNNNIQSLNDSNYMNINQLDILITNYTTTNNTLFKVM